MTNRQGYGFKIVFACHRGVLKFRSYETPK